MLRRTVRVALAALLVPSLVPPSHAAGDLASGREAVIERYRAENPGMLPRHVRAVLVGVGTINSLDQATNVVGGFSPRREVVQDIERVYGMLTDAETGIMKPSQVTILVTAPGADQSRPYSPRPAPPSWARDGADVRVGATLPAFKKAVLDAVGALSAATPASATAGPRDRLLIVYFTGHGCLDLESDTTSLVFADAAIDANGLPVGAAGLASPAWLLLNVTSTANKKNVDSLQIVDACFASEAQPYVGTDDSLFVGATFLAAGQSVARPFADPVDGAAVSRFTYELTSWRGVSPAVAPLSDGVLTLSELFQIASATGRAGQGDAPFARWPSGGLRDRVIAVAPATLGALQRAEDDRRDLWRRTLARLNGMGQAPAWAGHAALLFDRMLRGGQVAADDAALAEIYARGLDGPEPAEAALRAWIQTPAQQARWGDQLESASNAARQADAGGPLIRAVEAKIASLVASAPDLASAERAKLALESVRSRVALLDVQAKLAEAELDPSAASDDDLARASAAAAWLRESRAQLGPGDLKRLTDSEAKIETRRKWGAVRDRCRAILAGCSLPRKPTAADVTAVRGRLGRLNAVAGGTDLSGYLSVAELDQLALLGSRLAAADKQRDEQEVFKRLLVADLRAARGSPDAAVRARGERAAKSLRAAAAAAPDAGDAETIALAPLTAEEQALLSEWPAPSANVPVPAPALRLGWVCDTVAEKVANGMTPPQRDTVVASVWAAAPKGPSRAQILTEFFLLSGQPAARGTRPVYTSSGEVFAADGAPTMREVTLDISKLPRLNPPAVRVVPPSGRDRSAQSTPGRTRLLARVSLVPAGGGEPIGGPDDQPEFEFTVELRE